MMSRRSWFWVPAIMFPTSSCATGRAGATLSLAQTLQILSSIDTGTKFIEKFGNPSYRTNFNHDDPGNSYRPNRRSIEKWKESMEFISPPNLIDSLPINSRMLLYYFQYGSAINPTGGVLFICVDENDLIVGWMYDKALAGAESESWMQKSN